MTTTQEIHIDWDAHTDKEVQGMNGEADYGVYQLYGHHQIYGSDTLLYIGAADVAKDETFASVMNSKAISDLFDKYWTPDAMHICVGRLHGSETPECAEWSRQIDAAKKLLIFAHSLAWNSEELNLEYSADDDKQGLLNMHVFNWGKHKHLLPEVSGKRYARKYPAPEHYKPYAK